MKTIINHAKKKTSYSHSMNFIQVLLKTIKSAYSLSLKKKKKKKKKQVYKTNKLTSFIKMNLLMKTNFSFYYNNTHEYEIKLNH